ncbi:MULTISPECIES: envelope stress response membrane protein PspB [Ferrimonas]|uniref:Phage shock protein B n=1 Tax=Ferrimonas sediminum TaxID=718193 RepID=A0A1G9AUD7_9GAMM|nr:MULTISPECIES: envelope stress response membrane protein PspB [Ferrimonas]USD38566.1 envelope stress response membrane protein PspB [Ferrimonas sp. SCSIO 43195]SDK30514.1 phage shock protein B [Ferrimonas sediminum]
MEELMGLLIAPLIIFLLIVAPIWLILHYRSKKQLAQGLSDEEYQQLNALLTRADKMGERIDTLESILDQESPEWRTRHEA